MNSLVKKSLNEMFDHIDRLTFDMGIYYIFWNGIEQSKIDELENEFDIKLPKSYKEFLLRFDGGYISDRPVQSDHDFESCEWNSNNFLSVYQIAEHYKRIYYKFADLPEKYIPFMHTAGGELLVFKNPLDKENESVVLDAWHEVFPNEWEEQQVYDSFSDLLAAYLENEGIISTIG